MPNPPRPRILTRAAAGFAAAMLAWLCGGDIAASAERAKPSCDFCGPMVVVPAGRFLMGSAAAPNDASGHDRDETPQHSVSVASFALGRYEVSQAEWAAVMGKAPGNDPDPKLPVHGVTWDDAQRFVAKLNAKTGSHFRLPTEAEWEYAARAGSNSEFGVGDDETQLDAYVWFSENSGGAPHEGGQKKPNAFGLYDMSGNISEWMQDCYRDSYDNAPSDGSAVNVPGCTIHVLRGASWFNRASRMRPSNRNAPTLDSRIYDRGFRLARSLP